MRGLSLSVKMTVALLALALIPLGITTLILAGLNDKTFRQRALDYRLAGGGFELEEVEKLLEIAPPDALVVDIVGDTENRLSQLAALFRGGAVPKSRVVLVGPVDSFEPMSKALELGVADYVPIAAVSTKLPRTLRRILKKSR